MLIFLIKPIQYVYQKKRSSQNLLNGFLKVVKMATVVINSLIVEEGFFECFLASFNSSMPMYTFFLVKGCVCIHVNI